MRIAVNARFLKMPYEGMSVFAIETLQRIITNHPDDQFLMVMDGNCMQSIFTQPNVTFKYVGPKARHAISFKYWFDFAFTIAAARWKADLIFSPDNFCSLTTSIPQALVVHDLAYVHHPKFIPTLHRWFYKLYQKKFIQKAKKVIAVSQFTKADIIQQFQIPSEKIIVATNAARSFFKPLPWDIKEQIKASYSYNREYFVYVGSVHPRKNIINLLKAFSYFKRWQKSNMQLLIVGSAGKYHEELKEKLASYKYREDVQLLGLVDEEKLHRLIASAYALIYPSFFEGFGLPIVEAMQCGTPVITSNTSGMKEVGGDAALYADPNSFEMIGQQMINLYKNEGHRSHHIQLGYQQAKKFNWDDTAAIIYDCFCQISLKK